MFSTFFSSRGPQRRSIKVHPRKFSPLSTSDFDHVRGQRLAFKTKQGFVSPLSSSAAGVWNDSDWVGGSGGNRVNISRSNDKIYMAGKLVEVGVDPAGRIIVYRV
jgi:hypothetical protein